MTTSRAMVFLLLATAGAARADSLYDASTFQPLTADRRAHRVGDVITIHVYENSSATTSADTSTERTNQLDAGVGTSAINGGQTLNGAVAVNGKFEGGGTTQRANRLLATLSVTIQEVLANGDFRVAGEQLLTVNREQHKVTVEGRVRPEDVSADNTVLSTRLADAKISFVGRGDLTERNRRAMWRRFLDILGF